MWIKRVLAIICILAIVSAVMPGAAFAIWVNEDGVDKDLFSFRVVEGGELGIRFYNRSATQMNFYKDGDNYYADGPGFESDYLNAGMENAGNYLTVTEYAVIYYPAEMLDHFEVSVTWKPGYIFSWFVDESCGCYEDLEYEDGVYRATPKNSRTLKAIFKVDEYSFADTANPAEGQEETGGAVPTAGPRGSGIGGTASANPRVPGADEINITLDGMALSTDVPAYIESGRTMVPVRFISEALGAGVDWDDKMGLVTVGPVDGKRFLLTIGDANIQVVGMQGFHDVIKMDVSAVVKDGRTFVPVRYIAEALGLNVGWAQTTQTVILTSGSVADQY
jgi:hypothetical protein